MKQIDVLPDDVLLEIFDLYDHTSRLEVNLKRSMEAWQSLHVCRRWRNLVFRSPRRLNLQLFCAPNTPAKDTLDVWPALPIFVQGRMALSLRTDNVIAALGQSNRVCQVALWELSNRQLEKVMAAMQVPFPELTNLHLIFSWGSHNEIQPANPIPDSFLGGSVPSLQYFKLDRIPFPGLPKLLLSATHLVHLELSGIPHSGYISPEAMVALISTLSSLEKLSLGFRSPQSRPDWETRSLPPSKRSILPALKYFNFKGVTEYLEGLAARIDTPQVDKMHINFFNQTDSDCPRLTQFINCTPTFRTVDEARVQFDVIATLVQFRCRTSQSALGNLEIAISCREPDWQLSSIEQVCNSSLHPLSIVKDLYIERRFWELVWKNDGFEDTLWLELLLPFTTVKNLYLSKEFAPGIAAALKELVEGRITEVLPAWRIFSWRDSRRRDFSGKKLGSSSPRDSSPITLSPFLQKYCPACRIFS